MATGGAWQSEVYENGKTHPAAPTAPVPGVPASMYNRPTLASKDGPHVVVISFVLRAACIVFSVVAFALIASNRGETSEYTYPDGWSWTWWRSLNSTNSQYLLSINVIVCAYSIVQLIISIVSSCTGKPVLASPTKPASIITWVCDQALTYMLMAGCGAGAAMAINDQKGESGQLACDDGFRLACDKDAAATGMSFIAFLCLALSSSINYYRLHRIARV